ncbi:HAD family hydrolase [Streptomyces vilmorinianum]|uniref:HAD family hydrolase n=1 Tax=Streptomyces vilmorinianum TaxID=3051092 RepID=UPI0020C7E5BA|nr:HAD hydrolase-like protein [Streptomyces vilmorinianum]
MPTLLPPSPLPLKALLLDLDGVLLDTRPVMERAWQQVLNEHGLDVPFEEYERHLGRPFADIMERLGFAESERLHRTYDEASIAAAHRAREFDGIEEVLHAFVTAGWLLGIVTSKPLDRAAPSWPASDARSPRCVRRAVVGVASPRRTRFSSP